MKCFYLLTSTFTYTIGDILLLVQSKLLIDNLREALPVFFDELFIPKLRLFIIPGQCFFPVLLV